MIEKRLWNKFKIFVNLNLSYIIFFEYRWVIKFELWLKIFYESMFETSMNWESLPFRTMMNFHKTIPGKSEREWVLRSYHQRFFFCHIINHIIINHPLNNTVSGDFSCQCMDCEISFRFSMPIDNNFRGYSIS